MPDAWVAAHYGWNQFQVQLGPREHEKMKKFRGWETMTQEQSPRVQNEK